MICAGIDLESTGLLDPRHRIIEVHIQRWAMDPALIGTAHFAPTLERQATWRIHPDRSIDSKAQAVHHISIDDLAGKPKLEAVIDDILGYMRGVDLFVAHNGDEFDRPFLRLEIERVKPAALPFLDGTEWFDTMQEGRWATPWGKVPNLGELCWATDVTYDTTKAHAADYDVTVMMKAFFFGLQSSFFQPTLAEIARAA